VLFPPLSGQVVNDTLNDINMTQAGMMAGYGTGSVIISTSTVHAGAVKARVAKTGHDRSRAGGPPADEQRCRPRTIGANGRVAEPGSLGEASATCAAGAGVGIAAHAARLADASAPSRTL
jgi:hypothetical protein